MTLEILTSPPSAAADASLLTALCRDGLAPDHALDDLGSRLVAVRLVFPAGEATRCCVGYRPAFIAVDPDDPSLSEGERRRLDGLRPGHAVPGRALQSLSEGLVALPGRSLDIGAARDLGCGLERAVVITLADAALALVQPQAGESFTARTVAVVRGALTPPPLWRVASERVERVALSAGVPVASHECVV